VSGLVFKFQPKSVVNPFIRKDLKYFSARMKVLIY